MSVTMKKMLVPVSDADAQIFVDIVAATRGNGVYKMIDEAKQKPENADSDHPHFDVHAMREGFDVFAEADNARQPHADTDIGETELAGIPGLRLRPAGTLSDGTLIYLHGGGFTIGSVKGELGVADSFARSLRLETIALDYPQAPEHPFPEAIDVIFDAVRAIQLEKPGAPIMLAGDSAGGSLTISTALRLRERGLPQIQGIISVSAMLDWRLVNQSWTTFEGRDLVTRTVALFFRDGYIGDRDPADPAASPALADLTGLPPTLLIVGGGEVLLDDTLSLAENATRSGCDIETHIFDRLPHNFIKFAHPSADLAFEHAARWAKSRGLIA